MDLAPGNWLLSPDGELIYNGIHSRMASHSQITPTRSIGLSGQTTINTRTRYAPASPVMKKRPTTYL